MRDSADVMLIGLPGSQEVDEILHFGLPLRGKRPQLLDQTLFSMGIHAVLLLPSQTAQYQCDLSVSADSAVTTLVQLLLNNHPTFERDFAGRLPWRSCLHMSDLQNTVPDLLREHELRIGGDANQHVIELQQTALIDGHDAALAQQIDEVLEERAIEELG